jgi:protein-disulfide isomerase
MQPHPFSPWNAPPPYLPPPPPPSRTPWLIIFATLFLVFFAVTVIGGLSYVLISRSRTAAAVTWSDADSPVPVTSKDPSWGDRQAPVTLVVFGDFEDPFTAKLSPTIDSLKSLYGPSVLRVVWKHLPLSHHKNARDAAEAASGIYALKDSDAFFHFSERAFANQHTLSSSSYEMWAAESGVDMKKLRQGLARHTWMTKVDDDERLAHTLGVFTTPMSFLNGIQVTGTQSLAVWQHIIDDELPKTRIVMSSGVLGDRIYVTRSKDNFGTTPSAALLATATATATATTTYAPPSTSLTVHRVPVGSSPILGKKDALVTIVEFGDLQCPFCKRAQATLSGLRVKYGDDLRIVWKNEPLAFHVRAVPCAELALEARDERGDAAFWAVHDELYASSPTLDDATLLRIAHDHGVSDAKARIAITVGTHQTIIDADQTLAKKVGATGTPTFFVNGRMLSGAQPPASFETLIDEELTNAKARMAKSGIAKNQVYDAIMAEGTD